MITLDYVDGKLVLSGAYLDRDVVKTINGLTTESSRKWTLPATIATYLDAALTVKRDGGEIAPAADEWWAVAKVGIEHALAAKTQDYPATTLGTIELKPEQETDAQYLSGIGSGMILHPVRLGKTFLMLRTLDLLDKWPVLIAVKPKTILGIKRQVEAAFPNRTVAALTSGMTVVQRRKELEKEADIVLVGHNLLELHSRLLSFGGLTKAQRDKERTAGKYEDKELNAAGFRVVVVDEAHKIKNPKAAATRAAWMLGDKAEHRFIMTATPAPNSEDEWWAKLRFCYPLLFPAKSKWISQYIQMEKNHFGKEVCRGWKNVTYSDGPDSLNTKAAWELIFPLMHVRRERLNGPRQVERVIPVDLDKGQAKAYKQLAEHSMTLLGEDTLLSATDSMSLRHRLSQVAGGTPVVAGNKIIKLELPSAKIDALLEYLEEEPEAKTIVVCESRLLADLVITTLKDEAYRTVAIVGGMTPAQAAQSEDAIQIGDAQVIVLTGSGAEGFELSACRRTVFLEVSEDLVFDDQIRGRNLSSAQLADEVEVAFIYARGTLDEAKQESYVRKDAKLRENLHDKNWVKMRLFGDVRGSA